MLGRVIYHIRPMTPERILLNLHLSTRIRMDKVTLPMGSSRTKWINDAIPESVHPSAVPRVPVQPVQPVQPMEDGDFWGESEKVRALVKRHTR